MTGCLLYTSSPAASELNEISPDEIQALAREIGLVGLGGAAFPTAVKLAPPKDKLVDTYLLNGAECEPYLTADYRLMVEPVSYTHLDVYKRQGLRRPSLPGR